MGVDLLHLLPAKGQLPPHSEQVFFREQTGTQETLQRVESEIFGGAQNQRCDELGIPGEMVAAELHAPHRRQRGGGIPVGQGETGPPQLVKAEIPETLEIRHLFRKEKSRGKLPVTGGKRA